MSRHRQGQGKISVACVEWTGRVGKGFDSLGGFPCSKDIVNCAPATCYHLLVGNMQHTRVWL